MPSVGSGPNGPASELGPATAAAANGPRAQLRRRDTVAIIIGLVVGAGIFKTPALVAELTGDPGWMIAVWIAGAVISLIGALCYAELASAFPSAGGDYHFLTRAYGPHLSFLYAWARTMVINAGSIALLAFAFGDYVSAVIPLGAHSSAWWAAAVVIALTLLNLTGMHSSARTQNLLTLIQLAGLLLMVAAGLLLPSAPASVPAFSTTPDYGPFGLAMVFVLLTYGGWNEAAYVSAEQKRGQLAIVRALVLSIAVIAVLFLLVNLALLNGLGLQALRDSKTAGSDVMELALGPLGGKLLALTVAIAALASINATLIVSARTNYAVARDWALLGRLGAWSEQNNAPVAAYLFQALVALLLIGFGARQPDGFSAMVEYTAPVFWAFLTLVGVSVFILRAREAQVARPFRVPLYPLTPILFCLVCLYLLYASVSYAASQNAVYVSLWVMAAGSLALLLLCRGRKPLAAAREPA